MKVIASIVVAAVAVTALGCQGMTGGKGREVAVSVTDKGFEPNEIRVKKGEAVTLLMTRQTDQTCATEVVVADRGIRTQLPLNQEVRVALGPVEGGEVSFVCGMDMIKGKVIAD